MAILLITGLIAAGPEPRSADVLAAETALNHAVLMHDVNTAGTYLTQDYTLTLGSGKLMDRAALLAVAADRSISLSVNQAHDENVRFYGASTAIVTGIVEEAGTAGGNSFDLQLPFTDTWVLQNGRWLQAAGHASPSQKKPAN